nr:transposase [Streptomyces sp. SID4948]
MPVRRFVCEEKSCERMTFAEQVPGLARRFGRRTERLRSAPVSVALALAGRAGTRMTDALKVPVSRNTLLRLLTSLPDPAIAALPVVGVDEYAPRKGRVYGTVLVDVETPRPVDLLPDREADRLSAWPAERPAIEIASRDRAPFFLNAVLANCPELAALAEHVRSFGHVVAHLQGDHVADLDRSGHLHYRPAQPPALRPTPRTRPRRRHRGPHTALELPRRGRPVRIADQQPGLAVAERKSSRAGAP